MSSSVLGSFFVFGEMPVAQISGQLVLIWSTKERPCEEILGPFPHVGKKNFHPGKVGL